MTLENKIEPLKVIMPKLVFWLKPAGEDYCRGIYTQNEICTKSILMTRQRYPIECKYLLPNYDNPDLTKCVYKKW